MSDQLTYLPSINPISLVTRRAQGFDEPIDHDIVLERHAKFTGKSALQRFIHYLENKHFGYASTAIFFDYSERDQSACPDFASIIQEL